MSDAETKRCAMCEEFLPLDEFYVIDKRTGKRISYCKSCKSEYNRRWYQENREKQIADARRNNLRYIRENQEFVNAVKDVPCADCGGHFPPICLDFDHVRGEKLANVSELVRRANSLDAIRAEMEKCDIVCSNCHRIRTFARLRPTGG